MSPFEEGQWLGSRIEYIHYLKDNEVAAYKRLASLDGTGVPHFYGEYAFDTSDCASYIILLEFLPEQNLAGYTISSLQEAEALKFAGKALVRNMNASGVYHCDLKPWNLFWNKSSGMLKVVDF